VIAPDKAGKLLDEVVFERVMSFVDLPRLCLFQQELEVALIDVGVDYDEVTQVAKQMVDDALHRLAELSRTDEIGDCALCEQMLRDTRAHSSASRGS
jgi:hypothetical protein